MWLSDYLTPFSLLPQVRLLDGVELGPSLGMAKSSSLKSLHNVYKNTIKLDNDDGDKDSRKLRARGASFSVSSPTGERLVFCLDCVGPFIKA